MPVMINLEGQIFGWLTVEERSDKSPGVHWKCKCRCGNTLEVRAGSLSSGNTKSCGCYRIFRVKETCYRGTRDIPLTKWNKILIGAKERNINVEITIEYAQRVFDIQEGMCKLTGWNLCPSDLSLDRINSSAGYVEGNVQWVHKDINKSKLNFDQNRYIELSLAVADYYRQTSK